MGADFTNATIDTLTDDGDNISDNVSLSLNNEQDGIRSGFTMFINSGTIAANSVVVIAIGGVTNPVGEGSFIPDIMDTSGNSPNQSSAPSQAFGTPLIKLKVADPEGAAVQGANVWMGSTDMSSYANTGGETDVAGQTWFFPSDFYGAGTLSKSGEYSISISAPSDSEYTSPSQFTVDLTEGSTLDCSDRGSACDTANGGPILLTRPMAKGTVLVPASKPSTCNAAVGSAIQNVQVAVRDSQSMDPGSSSWIWTDESGVFRIGGLNAGTYTIEFSLMWGNENYVGLTPPEAITDFVVNANGSVTFDNDNDEVAETTAAASLPITLDSSLVTFQSAKKTITGQVVNEDGDGVADMRIRANKMMGMGDAQTVTAADGTYGMTVGTGNWWIMPEMDYSSNYDGNTENDVSADWIYCGMSKAVNFEGANSVQETSAGNNFTVKQANATIAGTVVDPNGEAVSGEASVNAFSKDGCGGFGQVDWDDGTFSITVPAGTYNVQANSWNPSYGSSAATTVTVGSGTTSLGNISLTAKNGRISGRLWADSNGNGSYDSGEGVGSTRVEAFKMQRKFDEFAGGMGGPMGGGDWASTSSSNDTSTKGNFTLNVTQGTWNVNVMADCGMMHGGYSTTATNYIYTGSPLQVNIASGDATSTGNNFELSVADATINGRLWIDSDDDGDFDNGEGVAGIYGYAFAEADGTYNQGPMMGMGMGAPVNNGTFSIKVPAGKYRVGVDFPPDTAGYTASSMATVTVAESSSTTVNVPVVQNNATLKVQFKDINGDLITSLGYAEVFLHNNAGAHQWQMFSTGDLTNGFVNVLTAPGDWYVGYHIDPTTDNYMSEPSSDNKVTTIANQSVTKDITLRSADSTVSGTVYDPSGSPLTGVFISTDNRKATGFDMAGPMFMMGNVTGADGTYSLTLPAGTYKVEARFPPSAVVSGQTVSYLNPDAQEVTISSTSPATANFTFQESDATITGTVTLSGNNQGCFVTAYSDTSGYNDTTSTNGSYSLDVTKDDTWYVRAMYETGSDFYQSPLYEVAMSGASTQTQNMTLTKASFGIPDPVSTTFSCANAKKISLSNGADISVPASAIQPSSVASCDSTDSTSNITLTINPTAQMSLQDQSIPIGVGYEISASDSNGNTISDTFNSNVTITIPYSDTEIETAVGGAVDESLLGNGYWDTSTSAWRTVDSEVLDADNNTLSISTNHFTLFGVLAATDASSTSGGDDSSDGTTTTTSGTGTSSVSHTAAWPMVDADGGGAIVEGYFNRVAFMVPNNALAYDADFEVNKLASGFNKPTPPLWIASGPYKVEMTAHYSGGEFYDFKKPVVLVIRYDPTALGAIPESSLRLNYYDNGRWRPISSLLIKDRGEVAAVINKNHGTYALIGGFGYQGASSLAEGTVTVEAEAEEIGISEEVLPKREIEAEEGEKHSSVGEINVQQPVPEPRKSWLSRLWEKIIGFFKRK